MQTVVISMKWPSLIAKNRENYALMKEKDLIGLSPDVIIKKKMLN